MTEPNSVQPGRPSAKEVFADIIELPRDERPAAVEARCANDAAVRAEVESLLRAHESAETFLRDPTLDPASQLDPSAGAGVAGVRGEGLGSQVGPYRLVEVLGEGGFGTVYLAEQERPVRRQVALKLIKLGMDSRQVVARFEAERQALALMDHPNIARVFDAGTTDAGRPYFVMELVRGAPITQYCDEQRLTPRQRLELFVPVCQAVQHAHQKGVIHRDIKPTNVLVAVHDGRPVPKVIDFGVAKATDARLAERSMFTEARQLVGTPEYMSPEQAGAADVDTRSDVYSLGVLLYELLTGTTPFDARELRSKAYAELQRVIREDDPPRPSTRLSAMRDRLPTVAANRDVEPGRLGTIVRGELDWIVMKCLEKDRGRRYQTVAALAADVLHHLADEPVAAAAPTVRYRTRKFARRHKLGLGVAAAVAASLVGGLLMATWGLVSARHERDLAVAAENKAVAARAAEAEAREHEREIDGFLVGTFESIDPARARGRPVLVREILDAAAGRMAAKPPGHGLVEASIRTTLGSTYRTLGAADVARAHLERAVELYRRVVVEDAGGEPAKALSRALDELAQAYAVLGDLPRAEQAALEAARRFEAAVGPDHPDAIAAGATLGEVLVRQSRYAEAEVLLTGLLDRARRSGQPDADVTLTVIYNLAGARDRSGQYGAAESLLRESLASARVAHGADHPMTIGFASALGDVLRESGKFDESVALLSEAYEASRRVGGPEHPDSLALGNNLALIHQVTGRLDESARLFNDTIDRRRRVIGDDAPATLLVRSNYGLTLQAQRKFDEAAETFADVAERMRRVLGPSHADTIIAENNVAWLELQTGDPASAEAIYRELLPRAKVALGPQSPAATSLSMRLGHALLLQEKWTDAEPFLAEAYAGAQRIGVGDTQSGYAAAYGMVLVKVGKPAEGLPLLLAADEMLARLPRADPAARRRVYEAIIEAHEALGQPDLASPWRQRLNSLAVAGPAATGPATLPTTTPTTTPVGR